MATEQERFEQKFDEIRGRVGVKGPEYNAEMERLIYKELCEDPNEDAAVIAFRIVARMSRAG